MARIFLTHPPEALKKFYGDKTIAGIKALGEVRFNSAGRDAMVSAHAHADPDQMRPAWRSL